MTTNLRPDGRGMRRRLIVETDRRSDLTPPATARRESVREHGRAWLNGGEAGGCEARYAHLERSHD